jgi:hypothetical protein
MASAGTIEVAIKATGSVEFVAQVQKAVDKLKETGGAAEGATKSLSGLSGVIAKAAGIAAGMFSIKKAFDFAKEADSIADATKVLNYMGGSIENLKTASLGMLSDQQLTSQAAFAASLGLSSDAMEKLTKAAVAASSVTGKDLAESLEQIVGGVVRGNTRILTQAGLLVDAEQAARDYADANGLLVDQLSDAQKQQAIMNAVVQDSARLQKIAEESGAGLVNVFSQFETEAANSAEELKAGLLPAVESLIRLWGELKTILVGDNFIKQTLIPAFQAMFDLVLNISDKFLVLAEVFSYLGLAVRSAFSLDAAKSFDDEVTAIFAKIEAMRTAIDQARAGIGGGGTEAFAKQENQKTPLKITLDEISVRSTVGQKSAPKKAEEDVLGQLIEGARRARESLFDLANSMQDQVRSNILSGPEQEVANAAAEIADKLNKAAALAQASGGGDSAGDLARVQKAAQDSFDQTVQKQLDGAKTLEEYNKIQAVAAERAAELGLSFKDTAKVFESARPTNTTELFAPIALAMANKITGSGKDNKDTLEIGAMLAPAMGGLLEGSGGPLAAALPKIFGQVIGSASGPIGTALGSAFGGAGGPVGSVIAGAVANGAQAIFGMLVDGFKQVVDFMVNAAQAIPQMVSEQAGKLGALIPSDKVQKFIQAAFNPMVGQAVLMAGVFATVGSVLVGVFAPVVLAVGNVLMAMAPAAAMLGAAVAGLIPGLVVMATVAAVAVATWGAFTTLVGTTVVHAITSTVAAWALAATAVGAAAAGLFLLLTPTGQAALGLGVLAGALLAPTAPLFGLAAAGALAAVGMMALAGVVVALGAATTGLALGFLKLAADTESFKRLGEAFEASMGRVVKALEPFFDNMLPLAGLFDALVSVIIPLASAFAANEQVARVMFDVFKIMAMGVGVGMLAVGLFVNTLMAGVILVAGSLKSFALAVDQVLDGVLFLMAKVTELLGGSTSGIWDVIGQKPDTSGLDALQEAARNMSPDIDAMAQALREIEGLTYEEADARARSLLKTKEASEELSNIPQGFKVMAARFRAITAESRGGAVADGGGGGGRNFIIDNLTVIADDPRAFAEDMEAQAERRAFQQTGTTGTRDGQNNGNN